MYEIIDLPRFGDDRGCLVAVEGLNTIPFEIKRIYYIYDTLLGVSRGFHAHRNLKQVVICVHGSCDFVIDDGRVRNSIRLNNPSKGLFIDGVYWREMHNFSADCVLMVMASEHYCPEDYISCYDDFLKLFRSL
ncbi:sugar 3,4-ketoisomerase [Aeromonas dhakensis]|uniref:sugar 3,4-ketoisomerase n=1 Tax=Aeromonas dhakensis TaxID=196024 RepID=UPI003EE354C9